MQIELDNLNENNCEMVHSTFAPKNSIGFGFTDEPFPKQVWLIKKEI